MRIVCAGDSLTRGVTFVHDRPRIVRDNYPSLLQAALRGEKKVEVLNRGAFNDNSDTLLARLDKDVLALQPDVVLVEIGGNDCNFRWGEVAASPEANHQPYVPLRRYIDNVTNLVKRIRDIGATPIFLTLVPLDPVRYYQYLAKAFGKQIAHWIALCGGIEYWHTGYHHALRQRLRELQVSEIDVREQDGQVVNWQDMLSEDGIHLTASGYQALSRVVFLALHNLNAFAATTTSSLAK
ncbi:SGNH/GDSL hydrolase family protein [Alicyclobacillus fodiniaquatilis]|uniref:SGNH/GDSL hydrolase family protein n=1 Tax=Alicyclobacillus fodiniaquatilis TaxID=1661150 RepID=A0ABW4JNJ7_9BACL